MRWTSAWNSCFSDASLSAFNSLALIPSTKIDSDSLKESDAY